MKPQPDSLFEKMAELTRPVSLSELPDIAKSLQLLKFSVELPGKATGGGLIEMAIKNGIEAGKIKSVVAMIKDMAIDNRGMMAGIIGDEMLNEIINY